MGKIGILFSVLLIASSNVYGQLQLQHEKKSFVSDSGSFFINKALPVYLYLSNTENPNDVIRIRSEQSEKYTNPLYFANEGYNTIRTPWLYNPVTKKYVLPKRDLLFEVYADSKSPATSISFKSKNLFNKGDTTFVGQVSDVYLNAKDELSGLEKIFISVDNMPYTAFNNSILFNTDKLFTLKYYSVDNVGNAENQKLRKIFPDRTSPLTKMKIAGDKFNDILSVRATISFSAEDLISGVSNTYYRIDSGMELRYITPVTISLLKEGEHTITFSSMDNVKNREIAQSYKFWLDKTAPIVLDEITGDSYYVGGKSFSSGRSKLKLTAVDNKAGVREILYKINNGELVKYEKPFYISNYSGATTIMFYAYDNVSNSSSSMVKSLGVNTSYVDLLGPNLNYKFIGPIFKMHDTTYISFATKINLNAADSEAGLNRIEYSILSGETVEYSQPFNVDKEVFITIDYFGYDNVNNSNRNSFDFKVDATGPKIDVFFSMKQFGIKTVDSIQVPVYPAHVMVWPTAFDELTGVDQIMVSINKAAFVPYSGQLKGFKMKSTNYIVFKATDKLGNETVKEIRFYCED